MDAYATERAPLTHRQTMLIVLGVLLPTFMGSLDQTILATALPTIGRDFDDMHSLPWLITAYLLASTAVIPLYGKIADIHGRRFTLRIAIATYMAGSLVYRSGLRSGTLAHGSRPAKRGAAPSTRHFDRDDELQQEPVCDHADRRVRRHRFGRSTGRSIARERL